MSLQASSILNQTSKNHQKNSKINFRHSLLQVFESANQNKIKNLKRYKKIYDNKSKLTNKTNKKGKNSSSK